MTMASPHHPKGFRDLPATVKHMQSTPIFATHPPTPGICRIGGGSLWLLLVSGGSASSAGFFSGDTSDGHTAQSLDRKQGH